MTNRPAQREAVVVSGATRGVGRATAIALARAGYRVYAGVVPAVEAERWKIETAEPGQVIPVALDVTSRQDVAALVDRVSADGFSLRALVNVAGIARFDAQERVDPELLRRMFDVNVFGTRDLSVAVLPLLKRSKGRLVFVTSMAARMTMPFLGGYSATKAAIEALADALRVELRPWGVSVAMVEPGGIRTDMATEELTHLQAAASRCEAVREHRPYAAGYAAMAQAVGRDLDKFLTPESVADCLARIVAAPRAPTRTVLGRDAHTVILLRKLLPDAWLDRLLAHQVRLSSP